MKRFVSFQKPVPALHSKFLNKEKPILTKPNRELQDKEKSHNTGQKLFPGATTQFCASHHFYSIKRISKMSTPIDCNSIHKINLVANFVGKEIIAEHGKCQCGNNKPDMLVFARVFTKLPQDDEAAGERNCQLVNDEIGFEG